MLIPYKLSQRNEVFDHTYPDQNGKDRATNWGCGGSAKQEFERWYQLEYDIGQVGCLLQPHDSRIVPQVGKVEVIHRKPDLNKANDQ